MKVYFDSGFWNKGKGKRGRRQAAGWCFEHAGMRCVIPAVYRFPKGIVFDILSFTDEAALRKYIECYESAEEKLTSSERRCMEQEHPFQSLSILEIWLNEVLVQDGVSYSHAISIPWVQQDESLELLRRAYRCYISNTQPFACQRVCVEYPKSASRKEKLLRSLQLNSIKSMRLITSDMQWFYPLDIRFDLPQCAGTQVEFLNPSTKQTHTLYFGETETTKLPVVPGIARRLYATQATYEIDPELPQGASLVFNTGITTGSIGIDAGGCFADTGCGSAASIGIIGGADGPTTIFVGTKEERQPKGPHSLPLHSCFSMPAFTESDACTFLLEGLSTTRIGKTVITLGGK